MQIEQAHAEAFLEWLVDGVTGEARGDGYQRLSVAPRGRFWLGRLAPQASVQDSPLGERAERLDPCATGFRVRPTALDGRDLKCRARMVAWKEIPGHGNEPDVDKWEKTDIVEVEVDLRCPDSPGEATRSGQKEISASLTAVSADGLVGEIQAEIEMGQLGPELVVTLVNVSPPEIDGLDTNLYETELEVDVGPTQPFRLDTLADSFRYDRMVPAYGINGGVVQKNATVFATVDYAQGERHRPDYSDEGTQFAAPKLTFGDLSQDPLPKLQALVESFHGWTRENWSSETLKERASREDWSEDMKKEARAEALTARTEVGRLRSGLELLNTHPMLLRAFSLANEAFERTVTIDYDSWRPFQVGFVLANIGSLTRETSLEEREYLDTLWFATGGGKTETYLLFTLTAAFLDRLQGKLYGISSWTRFPLRMLSLQQTQRFADVLAAAELIRRREMIPGTVFGLGFFVGNSGSPNRVVKSARARAYDVSDSDLHDAETRARYRILIHCPFCSSTDLDIRFDQAMWWLQHLCMNPKCPWGRMPLPFHIVDEEIYRLLPTVVLGTLDKAANVSRQAAMRGFYGPPSGLCPVPGHGFTYAPRGGRRHGCLFPDCNRQTAPLPQDESLFGPSIRMQDELHLLRGSLGAIDSHYEAILDDLQDHAGNPPKIIASSATLAGHSEQVRALYRRKGRTFPTPGPWADRSFWTQDSHRLARRYLGLAPRGVTLEYANDQLTTTVQEAMRRALDQPKLVALESGVPECAIDGLVWGYGVGVTYGSTLKDVEAAARSFESQIQIEDMNSHMLTGRTPLDDVRSIIERVKEPETRFADRIHMIAASSMLSHGVDLDRLNVMVMLGLPLATAEFIQTTARVGRTHPGLVFVMHKIGRERDAAVFRTFPSFIRHMDRLVDPVPITGKSRRVLELTFPGLEMSRIQGIHEPEAIDRGLRQLTKPAPLRRAFTVLGIKEEDELQALVSALDYEGPLDANLRDDLAKYFREFYRSLNDPASDAEWPSDLFRQDPMLSLRDVEKQIPIYSRGGE